MNNKVYVTRKLFNLKMTEGILTCDI
jgi:hypothetical protein